MNNIKELIIKQELSFLVSEYLMYFINTYEDSLSKKRKGMGEKVVTISANDFKI